MTLNLAPSGTEGLTVAITREIDAFLQRENDKQEPRDYLGGSRLGVECMRQLWYEFNMPKAAAPFPGRILRRFRLGHMHEEETAAWLRGAGFDLRRQNEQEGEFAFSVQGYPLGGHFDGDIFGGPLDLPYPFLWEHKIMNKASWAKFHNSGVAISHPTYYAQCTVYAASVGRAHTLFTALNTDTSELEFELVATDLGKANALVAKGIKIVTAKGENDMPRIADVSTDYRCKFCNFNATCWRQQAAPTPAPAAQGKHIPSWMKSKGV